VSERKPSRTLWLAAILVSVVCVGGLAYGLVTSWDAEPDRTLPDREPATRSSGFGLGLLVGIGAGIVIGSLLAIRRRS
jgi:hypothetical protein